MQGAVPRPRIWIVDDDADLRDALIDFLGESGFDVVAFADGASAWAALTGGSETPDAIVLDNHMPLMNGLELRRRQLERAELAAIPTIIYTASGPLVVAGALVISKNADAEVLVAALRTACADRLAASELVSHAGDDGVGDAPHAALDATRGERVPR